MLSDMLRSIFLRKKSSLSFEEIQILQLVVQQTVISIESLDSVPQKGKSRLACEMTEDHLKELGIEAPTFLIETVVDASLHLFHELRPLRDAVSLKQILA